MINKITIANQIVEKNWQVLNFDSRAAQIGSARSCSFACKHY